MTDFRSDADQATQAKDDQDLALITDYLAHELSPAQRAQVEERLRTDAPFYRMARPLLIAWSVPMFREPAEAGESEEAHVPTQDEIRAVVSTERMEQDLANLGAHLGLEDGFWEETEEWQQWKTADARDAERKTARAAEQALRLEQSEATYRDWEPDEESAGAKVLAFPKRVWESRFARGWAAGIIVTLLAANGPAFVYQAYQSRVESNLAHREEQELKIAGRPFPDRIYAGPRDDRFVVLGLAGLLGSGSRMVINGLGAVGDSSVTASLSGDVAINLSPLVREMTIAVWPKGGFVNQPQALVKLMAPGHYAIHAVQGTTYVTVDSGLAEVTHPAATKHDVTTVRAGEHAMIPVQGLPVRTPSGPEYPKGIVPNP